MQTDGGAYDLRLGALMGEQRYQKQDKKSDAQSDPSRQEGRDGPGH